MTTPATTPRLNYIADGSTTAFTFNFKIADSNSIAVYVGSTLKTLTTDYTVTFDSGTAGTGTIVFNIAPTTASAVYLIRDTYNVRATDFQEGGAFLASTINAELDRLTQGLQDLENKIDNRVLASAEPNDESASTLTFGSAAARANKSLAFDASGNLTASSAGTGTVTSVATGTGLTGGPVTTTGTISIDSTVATLTGSQTLTNKTINSASNTITITESNISDLGSYITASSGDTLTNKSGNISQWTNNSGYLTSALLDIVSDTTPQLGGNLDVNGQSIVSVSNGDITLTANGTGRILLQPGTNGVQVTTGNLSVNAGYLESEGIRIEDNKILTSRSNDNLILDPAGTGVIQTNSNINLNGYKVVGGSTAAPSADGDLANKKYVDDEIGAIGYQDRIQSITTNVVAASTSVTTTVAGNTEMVVTDDGVRILGNLTVDGTQTILNTSTLSVEDNIITVNRNISTVGAMPTNSGLEINRGNASAATLYWNETDDKWTVGSNTFVAGTFEGNLTGNADTATAVANVITIVGDDSTGTTLNSQESFKIAGSTGITTAVSDDTLTITGPDLSSYITNSPITVVGDDSTGTVFNTGETIKIAGGTGITTAVSGDTLTITNSGTGTITALNNQAENRITTIGATTTDLDGEANLTFNGSTLTLTGTAALDGVTITDNTISTNASNADLEISANGTGSVALGAGTIDNTVLAYNVLQSSGASERGATRSYLKTVDWSTASSNADRIYGNTDYMGITVSGSGTGNSRERVRQIQLIQIDSAGYNLPYSHGAYGANTNITATELRNSSGSASSVSEVTAHTTFVKVGDNNTAGNLTVSDMTGSVNNLSVVAPTGTTVSVTNAYGSVSTMEGHGGAGTVDVTNYYAYYAKDEANAPATNQYGFYVEDDAWQNRIGGVILQNGAISTDGITINDNNIGTTRSNDNLNITANGSGYISLGEDFDTVSTNTRYHYGTNRTYSGTHSGSTNQHINNDGYKVTLTGDLTGSGTVVQEVRSIFDLNGYDSTASSTKKARGPVGFRINPFIQNNSASASTVTEASGFNNFSSMSAGAGDLTITDWVVNSALPHLAANTGLTATATNCYGFFSTGGIDDGGAGTKTIGTLYHYYATPSEVAPTTEYAFYSNGDDLLNRAGKFERYREKINALTSSSTITVDCGLAPVHTVTLATNTQFNIANLGTGQTATIIITQDGTGNKTASFGTDASTTVKFPGGVPSLSVLVVEILIL
jgi:hypothetical protein